MGALLTEVNGLKYFKLISKYPGDYTKNCGLLGNEIDENFYFLRSMDISGITLDENRQLIVTRVDGEELTVDLKDYDKVKFNFDKKAGTLTIIYPDGETEVLGGFLISGYVDIASNETLKGKGTMTNPIGISEVERTGTYAPALYFKDLAAKSIYYHKELYNDIILAYKEISRNDIPESATVETVKIVPIASVDSPEYIHYISEAQPMPKANKKGDRIVTKESQDNFGRLYTYEGVKEIMKQLDEDTSPWRVPTREDWAKMLNAAEPCEEDRNHDTLDVNTWTGRHAGARAKSDTLWVNSDILEDGYSVKGENNLGQDNNMFCVYPVGDGDGSRGAHDMDFDIEAFGKRSTFWSSTNVCTVRGTETPNIYSRSFAFDTRTVLQESSKPSSRFSLRLVRDYYGDGKQIKETETILGQTVPCTLICNEETDYAGVWTSINLGFTQPEFSGVTSQQWSAATETEMGVTDVYYINEWDGCKWVKKAMQPGDSVVILDYDNDPSTSGDTYHEWRLYDLGGGKQELIDTAVALKEEFKDALDDINERIDAVETELGETRDTLNQKIDRVELSLNQKIDSVNTNLNLKIDSVNESLNIKIDTVNSELNKKIDDTESFLNSKIDAVNESLNSKIDQSVESLNAKIDQKVEELNTKIDGVNETLNSKIDNVNETLNQKIDAEIERSTKRDDELEGEDIASEGIEYVMYADNRGLTLQRKNESTFNIAFDGDFGEDF